MKLIIEQLRIVSQSVENSKTLCSMSLAPCFSNLSTMMYCFDKFHSNFLSARTRYALTYLYELIPSSNETQQCVTYEYTHKGSFIASNLISDIHFYITSPTHNRYPPLDRLLTPSYLERRQPNNQYTHAHAGPNDT